MRRPMGLSLPEDAIVIAWAPRPFIAQPTRGACGDAAALDNEGDMCVGRAGWGIPSFIHENTRREHHGPWIAGQTCDRHRG